MIFSRTVCLGLGGGDPASYSQPGQLWALGVCMGSPCQWLLSSQDLGWPRGPKDKQ